MMVMGKKNWKAVACHLYKYALFMHLSTDHKTQRIVVNNTRNRIATGEVQEMGSHNNCTMPCDAMQWTV